LLFGVYRRLKVFLTSRLALSGLHGLCPQEIKGNTAAGTADSIWNGPLGLGNMATGKILLCPYRNQGQP